MGWSVVELLLSAMNTRVENILNEFAQVLNVVLPPNISKSFEFKVLDGEFLVHVESLDREVLFSDVTSSAEFQSLTGGLKGKIRPSGIHGGAFKATIVFSLDNLFMKTLKDNLSTWGLVHPIRAIKQGWKNSKVVDVIEKK